MKRKVQRKQHGKWEAGLRNLRPLRDRIEELEQSTRVLEAQVKAHQRDIGWLLSRAVADGPSRI